MSSSPSLWIDNFAMTVGQSGACAWGISTAEELPDNIIDKMNLWIEGGNHAGMEYLQRHVELKKSLDNVLPGCKSIVSLAFPYFTELKRKPGTITISRHALGEDYHSVIKRKLRDIARHVKEKFGGKVRTVVDSAPVAERYWAVKSRVGMIGRNGLLYVPGFGSWVFLGEILSTAQLPEHKGPATLSQPDQCRHCSLCIDRCPGHAIGGSNEIDCNRCRSYLTIENHDKTLPSGINLGNSIYGCDICQEVCPLNSDIPTHNPDFSPLDKLVSLTPDDIARLDEPEFESLVKGTSMQRITLGQLKRNAGLQAE